MNYIIVAFINKCGSNMLVILVEGGGHTMNNKLDTISNLFEGKEIRSIWDSRKEEYYFSVVKIFKERIFKGK